MVPAAFDGPLGSTAFTGANRLAAALGAGGYHLGVEAGSSILQCFEHCPLLVWGRESYFGTADVGTGVQFHSPRVASLHRCPSLSYDERQIMGQSVRPV